MTARQLWFTGPEEVEVRNIEIAEPQDGETEIKTLLCGISSGTESLLWHGDFPKDINLDESIPSLKRPAEYPCPYGYNLIGTIPNGDELVLAFHPHADRAVVGNEAWLALPRHWEPERAVLLPNTETAMGIVHDASPRLGERIIVIGLGVVGLLCLSMLAEYPLERLIGVDISEPRRIRARKIRGALIMDLDELADDPIFGDADRVIEVSGNPKGLQTAVDAAGYDGRIVIGSWYGGKDVRLDLGPAFHRRRQHIISSQVSTLAPELRGRWTHDRRFHSAVDWLERNGHPEWVTHFFRLDDAQDAYRLIDSQEDSLQIVLTP